MKNAIKIVVGLILLGSSMLYLLGVVLTIVNVEETASYQMEHFLEFAYVDHNEIQDPEILEEIIQMAEDYRQESLYEYTCYKLDLKAVNHSTAAYFSNPADALWWMAGVEESLYPEQNPDYEKLFYQSSEPALPGKAEVPVTLYVFTEPYTTSIQASYSPNWDEEEIFLEILLK